MLSPGRISPIDSISTVDPPPKIEIPTPLFPESTPSGLQPSSRVLTVALKGKNGKHLEIELDAGVLCRSSKFFAAMVAEDRQKSFEKSTRIEIADIEDLGAFKEALEMMMSEKDAMNYLIRVGVSRSIDILEVSVLQFSSCLLI